ISTAVLAAACGGPTPPSGPASGDLRGQFPGPAVAGFQGGPVPRPPPAGGPTPRGDGAPWALRPPPGERGRTVGAAGIKRDGSVEGPSLGGVRAELDTTSDVERRFRVTFDGYRVPDADHTYVTSAQVQVGAGAVTMQTLTNFIFVRVRPMGSGDRLGIEVREIVP